MSKPNSGRIIGIAKKNAIVYTKKNFSMYSCWFREYFIIHRKIYEIIGENLENFYKIFDNKFFDWLNYPKNSSKFMFEIKKVFMEMADEVLLYEIMIERFKKSENRFVIPLFEKNSESESDIDIDSYHPTLIAKQIDYSFGEESIHEHMAQLYGVDYKTSKDSNLTIMNFLPSAGNLELTEIGIREIIGRLFYLVKG